MSRSFEPMLAKLASQPFSNKDWIYEIKWDGFRAIAYINKNLSLRSRNGKELKYSFPELNELTELTSNVVLDGEIIVMMNGKADFQSLLERNKALSETEIELQSKRSPAVYVIFDILEKDGKMLINLPLIERKKILKNSVQEGQHVLLSDFVETNGEAYYTAALEKGLEGIVAKKRDSPYEPGLRSGNWLKLRKLNSCDCVIFGYTQGTGTRKKTFGALLIGLYSKEGKPVYIGKVGTGFSQETLQTLSEKFLGLETETKPFEVDVREQVKWLRPKLVCEVLYQVVTRDVRLRMPRFRSLREDKIPSECTLDQIAQSGLSEYISKRNFKVTTEPKGGAEKGNRTGVFVVQEHHARRLHFDLRLEKDGVLKSWAVPKGFPETTDEKRLAVETEDHPLEYASFEGTIPTGQYGAGTVKIWDKGSYDPKVWSDNIIEFRLKGEKLQGRFVLVRLKKAKEKSWLLLKGRE
jgi:DNA ligase D-like protein (predicted ligase)/DNA ligase D-like protein (predicted 3'-phosphoesterase)